MNNRSIYLDYMATTPVDPSVIEAMLPYLGYKGGFGNSGSQHAYGQHAERALAHAREQVASVVNAHPEAIVFTSGATESNNLAILGSSSFYARKGRHLITMQTEHKAVLDSFKQLEAEGFEVTYLPPKPDGLLDLKVLEASIRPDTILVSVMHVNNEIGVVQDIKAIGACLNGRGIIFHVDAAQSIGRVPLDLADTAVDLVSLSAHKAYGPKGIGALFVRQKPRIRLAPQSFGGGQEGGLRSGTLATHQIVGLGTACELAGENLPEEMMRISALRDKLWQGLSALPNSQLNGHPTQRVAGNLNVSFTGIDGESLIMALNTIAVSSGSACTSASMEPSYVLRAIGCDAETAHSGLRFSVGRYTSDEDIDQAIEKVTSVVKSMLEANRQ